MFMKRLLCVEVIHPLKLSSSPSLSRDRSQIVYVVRTTDLEGDADRYALWSIWTPDASGESVPVQPTRSAFDTSSTYSPDSRWAGRL
jgi:hypothetical protein